MVDHAQLLSDGIHAARLGDKHTARRLLTEAVRRDPTSITAWLWLGGVLDTQQGRAHCLRQVLALDPDNDMARRGLAALEAAGVAPVLVAQPRPPEPRRPAATGEPAPARLASLKHSAEPAAAPAAPAAARPAEVQAAPPRVWRIVVVGLAVAGLALIALLVYAALSPGAGSRAALLAAEPEAHIAGPAARATLRPTFTPEPADSPPPAGLTPEPGQAADAPAAFVLPPMLATFTPAPTFPFDQLPAMLATFTPTPAETAKPTRRAVRARPTTAVPPPTVVPHAPLPPRAWDPRLTALNVRFEPAPAAPGQAYWRLVEARWADPVESEGRHAIYVEVLNAEGGRAVGQPVILEWSTGSEAVAVQNPRAPDWPLNFPMYNTLGSYSARVGGGPSDKVIGLGLGTAEAPNFTVHTSFYLTFRWVVP